MSVVDKVVNEWAFRCKKGYPDMNNPDDVRILKDIYSEFGFVMEAEEAQEDDEIDLDSNEHPKVEPKPILKGATFNYKGENYIVTQDSVDGDIKATTSNTSPIRTFTRKELIDAKTFPLNPKTTKSKSLKITTPKAKGEPKEKREPKVQLPKTEYNDVIIKALGKVPAIEGEASKYILDTAGTEIQITNPHDLYILRQLYKVAPPKGNQQAGSAGSKGSGHGEIALYWLLSQAGRNVQDSRGGSRADLLVDNIGVEVKSYSKEKDMVQLGRVGKYTTELLKLNTVFGINALLTTFSGTGKKKLPPNAIHANGDDMEEACKHVLALYEIKEKMQQYGLTFLDSMFSKIDEILAHAKPKEKADELAATLLKDLLKAKFKDKPIGSANEGAGGYMVNVTPDGDIDYTYITMEMIDAIPTEKVLKGVFINQGMINYSRRLFK